MGVKKLSVIVLILFFALSISVVALGNSGAAKSSDSSNLVSYGSKLKTTDAHILSSSVQITSMDPPNYEMYNNQSIQSFTVTITTDVPATCYVTGNNTLPLEDRLLFNVTGGTTHQVAFNDFENGYYYWSFFICQDSQSGLSEEMMYLWFIDYEVPEMTLVQQPEENVKENKLQTIEARFSDQEWGFYEDQSCFYCVGLTGFCDNNSNWNMTQNTFILNESNFYLNGTCSQSFNTSDYINGQYEFGIWIGDMAHNGVTRTGNFTINRPVVPTLMLDNYSINNTRVFDGDVVKVFANWTTNTTNITCRLYSRNQELQNNTYYNNSCKFNYIISQKDYPFVELYIKATAFDGYEATTPIMNITMNPCGMRIVSNFTLQDNMLCSFGNRTLYYDMNALNQQNNFEVDCNGYTIKTNSTNMTGIVMSSYFGGRWILKNCRIENFVKAILNNAYNLNLTIYNTTFENNTILLESGVFGVAYTNIIDTNIVGSNATLKDGVSHPANLIINTYSKIENSYLKITNIIFNNGTLEIINSTIYLGNQRLNLSGNYTSENVFGNLSFNNYSTNVTVGYDGDRIRISTEWNKINNPLMPINSSIICKLYSKDQELQSINSSNLSCTFSYIMGQKDYPFAELYVKAITSEGYEATTPEINIKLNPCGMTLISNFTLQDDMLCAFGNRSLYYDRNVWGQQNNIEIDCNGHTIKANSTNMSGIVTSSYMGGFLTIKNCHIENFDKAIVNQLYNFNISVYNTKFENNTLLIGLSGYGVAYIDLIDANITGSNATLKDNISRPANLIVNTHSKIENTNLKITNIIFNNGTLEVINSTIYLGNRKLNLTGNYSDILLGYAHGNNYSVQISSGDYYVLIHTTSPYPIISSIFAWKIILDNVNSQYPIKSFDIQANYSNTTSMDNAHFEINYTDLELSTLNIDESSLKAYYYNESNNTWEIVSVQGIDLNSNLLWFNTTHFSTYTIAGNKIPAPVVITPVKKSSGGGGGGGGGPAISSDIKITLDSNGTSYSPDKNQKMYFTYDSKNHTMIITAISGSSMLINIDDTILNVSINESVKYSLNDAMLELKLLKIYGSSAATIFVRLDKAAVSYPKKEDTTQTTITTESSESSINIIPSTNNSNNLITGNVASDTQAKSSINIWSIIIGSIFIIALIVGAIYLTHHLKKHHKHKRK